MMNNYRMSPDRIIRNTHNVIGAKKPWNGPDAEHGSSGRIRTADTPEQMARCQNCPLPKCNGSPGRWYRLGLDGPQRRCGK